MANPKSVFFRILAALVIVAAAAAVIRFRVKAPSRSDDPDRLVLYGNVDIRQVSLAFNGSERISRMLKQEGDTVRKGELLATLDTVRMELSVRRAEAMTAAQKAVVARLEAGTRTEEIQKARAEADAARIMAANARRTFGRIQPLAAGNLASAEQADDARSLAEAGEARLRAAEETLRLALAGPRSEDIEAARETLSAYEAELALARRILEDASLAAPADGIIQNRILEPGDMASPQRPVFTLALTDPLWVRTYVPETHLARIFPGMKAAVTTDGFPDRPLPGWVGYISPSAEFTPKNVETPELRSHLVYQVRVFVCNPDRTLRLGMPVTVAIPLDQPQAEGSTPCAGGR